MERRAEATGGRTRRRAGRDPASPSGSAPAAADSRDGVAAGRARAPPSQEIRRGSRGAVAAGADARGPRRTTTRDARRRPYPRRISKASERRGARSARRGGDDDVPSRSTRRDPDPYPSLTSFEGWSAFAAPPGARGCACAARARTPWDEKDASTLMTFSPDGEPVCIFLTLHRSISITAGWSDTPPVDTRALVRAVGRLRRARSRLASQHARHRARHHHALLSFCPTPFSFCPTPFSFCPPPVTLTTLTRRDRRRR